MNIEIRTAKMNEKEYYKEIRGYIFHRPTFLSLEEQERVDSEGLYYEYLANEDRFRAKAKELAKLFANN